MDLEEALLQHAAVRETAVIGAPSREWGETPVGFVTLRAGERATADELRIFANKKLGKRSV